MKPELVLEKENLKKGQKCFIVHTPAISIVDTPLQASKKLGDQIVMF